MKSINELAEKILKNDRRSIAKAITLVESSRPDHREQAVELIALLSGSENQALKIGLSGTPGVGKSTFIESFGLKLIELGQSVAVLAVDPSSIRSGGSILGDKTRMEKLSRKQRAFIRPSPSLAHLGGVSLRTRESIAICEAAGFDTILIETVGVGQSEIMVSQMSDIFVLLLSPGGGDELQGVKRGIMEIADLIVVNKADGDLLSAAKRTQTDYSSALGLLKVREEDMEGFPKVSLVSSISGEGLDTVWKDIKALTNWRKDNGFWENNRKSQAVHWFKDQVQNGVINKIFSESAVNVELEKLSEKVSRNELSPDLAAQQFISKFLK